MRGDLLLASGMWPLSDMIWILSDIIWIWMTKHRRTIWPKIKYISHLVVNCNMIAHHLLIKIKTMKHLRGAIISFLLW